MVKRIILLFTLYICVVDIYILPFKFILQINVMIYTITSINSFFVNNNKKALKNFKRNLLHSSDATFYLKKEFSSSLHF